MKKALTFPLVLVLMLACAFAFVACGEKEEEFTEQGFGANERYHNNTGVDIKLEVTVQGQAIAKIEIIEDNFRSPYGSWSNNKEAFIQSFVGMKVKDVEALVANKTTAAWDSSDGGSIEGMAPVSRATASSVATVLAIQDALSKMPDSVRK